MEEISHILNILVKVKSALERKDSIKIKNLSNKFIHHASIHQDADVISIAVIIYSLSKMLERESYKTEKSWYEFYNNYCRSINGMITALKKKDESRFHDEIIRSRNLIQGLSGRLKIFISDVFRRAQINKASRIYEHGISMEKTAKILGVSLWELSEYSGETGISDVNLAVTMPIKERIKLAEEIFS